MKPLYSILRLPTRRLAGLALSGGLAALAAQLAARPWFGARGFSALSLAIVLGIAVGNTVYPRVATHCAPGVDVAKQTLLRAGIVLYGLRLTLADIGHVGANGVLLACLMLASTFAVAVFVGTRWLKLEPTLCILIGSGSAICGAAAVMATAPVVKSRAENIAVAVSTVVVFGTLAIFVYPLLYRLNLAAGWLPGGEQGFGIYAGATIHEVAQVLAATRGIGEAASGYALIVKLTRVLLLAPFLLALSAWLARAGTHADRRQRPALPWFAFGFVASVLLRSTLPLPAWTLALSRTADTLLLGATMAALGLSTHLSAIKRAGAKPLWLAAMLFVWLIGGGAVLHALLAHV